MLEFEKEIGEGKQTKGKGFAKAACILFNSNLNTAKLQFVLLFVGDHTPGVLVKPKSFPPHAPQTA